MAATTLRNQASEPLEPRTRETSADRDGALIAIEKMTIRFGRQTVLREVSLEIERGETVAIIGESGCGKTVLLKTIVALIAPTTGRVLFDGRDMHRLDDRALTAQRLRFGFVFQQAALFDSLDIYENVAFAMREHTSMSEQEIAAQVQRRLSQVGLSTDIVGKKPSQLSGGMRKRVGLARAIAIDPEVMLYDEPTTGLDPIMSDVINELILKTRAAPRAKPVTGIVVTHDMKSALKIATRVVMLYPVSRLDEGEGQILFDGSPEALQAATDPRVRQFVRGEAGNRIQEAEL